MVLSLVALGHKWVQNVVCISCSLLLMHVCVQHPPCFRKSFLESYESVSVTSPPVSYTYLAVATIFCVSCSCPNFHSPWLGIHLLLPLSSTATMRTLNVTKVMPLGTLKVSYCQELCSWKIKWPSSPISVNLGSTHCSVPCILQGLLWEQASFYSPFPKETASIWTAGKPSSHFPFYLQLKDFLPKTFFFPSTSPLHESNLDGKYGQWFIVIFGETATSLVSRF
jgi:hypothetical protein